MTLAPHSSLRLTALALALASIGAQADTYTWTNDSSGQWTLPANWTPVGLPNAGSDVFISVTGVKTITHGTGNDAIRTLNFEASAPNPNAVLLVNGGSSLAVSSGGTNGGVIRADGGTVSFTGGTLVNDGTLAALNNGVVSFQNTALQGGTLSAGAGTAIRFGNTSTIDGGTHGAVTNTGAVQINQSTTVFGRGSVTNNGTIVVGANADFRVINADSLTFNGSGSLTLASDANIGTAQLYTDNGTAITNGANHTIQGVGNFGRGSTSIANQGIVTANVAGGVLSIDPVGGPRDTVGFTNTGTLRAENGGALVLQAGTYDNSHGLIQARTGSQVVFGNADIQGGVLATVGTGSILTQNGTTLDGVTAGALSNTGALTIANSSTTFATGTLNNTGSIVIGANADFRAINSDAITFTGNGTVTLASDPSIGTSQLYTDNATLITNGAGHTIQGAGNLGRGSSVILNQGTVVANDSANGPLNVSVASTFTNTGTLRADHGTLNLQQGTFVNNTTIDAVNNGIVNISGGGTVIQGGHLATASGGSINIGGSATLDGLTNGAITVAGKLTENNSTTTFVRGTINDTGSIVIGANADFRAINADAITFAGNGTVTLASNAAVGTSQLYTDNATLITNGAGHTIQGAGNLGRGSSVILNQGTIVANDASGPLNVSVASTFTNSGTLRADNGTLNLQQGIFVNNTAIDAINGGTVNISGGGTVIRGGTLSTASGAHTIISNNATLDGTSASNGPIKIVGALVEGNSTTTFVRGTINDTGSIVIGANADFRVINSDALTFTGNGTVTLASDPSIGTSQLYTDNATLITNGAGHTIQGAGNLGRGSSVILNQGIVVANDASGPLNVAVATTFTNSGTLRADHGTLNLQQGTFVNNTTIDAVNNGIVNISGGGTVIQGGHLATASGGSINVGGSATLDGLTNGAITVVGKLTENNSTTTFVRGTINDTGSIVIGANADFRAVNSDTITFTGNGTVTLASDPSIGTSQLFTDNGTLITNGAGHTIQGAGNFGRGTSAITNAGTVAANVSGQTLSLASSTPTIQSTGVLAASNGGTLDIGNAVTGTGTIRTDSGGTVVLHQAAQTGQLINNASLSIGTHNVTVSADYKNANFGSGNAFDRHAGVSGTGQILAAGDVAQAITGTTVTNGTSGTPTLTIGNVRVGGTTYDYQVANSGTTGPAIRGAIQTSVNGGNITDARLSGSGVTAGNYGPVATGANSGNLGVTFTAATAGALAPLAGQSIHVANNFDNVAGQTLAITLASGAAAYNAAVGATTPSPVVVANQRVGGSGSQALTVQNTAAAGNFSEALNATVGGATGGATSNGATVTNIAAGASNTGALSVGVNTATSGAKTGNVTIAYQTDGTGSNGHSGLAAIGAGSQTIAVSGNVYQAAAGTITTAPYNFGTVQVGQNVNQTLAIRNTATGAAGYVEDLNATFGASYGTGGNRISGTGSVNQLVAGGTSNGLSVHVDTSSAGTVAGGIAVNFATAGTVNGASNGLGTASVGSANYGVSGTIATTANVVDQASPVVNNAPIALGNVRIGSASPTATVSVTNQATGNQQAALNASISGNFPVTAAGSFALLAPGATNNTSLSVGIDTSSAGSRNGTATIAFVSDASNIGGCSPNCQMTLPSQDVAVTGAVYRLANPTIGSAPITVAGRVGSTSPVTSIAITNASPDGYTEALSASRGATSNGFTSSGSVVNLAAGGTSSAIGVMLDTTTAGTFSGTQALHFVSTGAGTDNAADLSVGNGSIVLNGKVYTPAVAQNNTPSVNFGIVHVGDTATHAVSVTNAASVTALNDTLVASASGTTGGFGASGNLGAGLAAQQTATTLSVSMDTHGSGVKNGLATFSAGSHDGDLSDAALANLVVSLSGQVNNYASDAFAFAGGAGTLSRSGSTFVLDFGTVAQGTATQTATLRAVNDATGLADLLDGTFQFLDTPDFGEAGFGAFFDLAAGQGDGPLMLAFDAATIGAFSDTIVLHGIGHNASGYAGALGDLSLIVRGNVVGGQVTPPGTVPEPDALWLIAFGVPFLLRRRGARR